MINFQNTWRRHQKFHPIEMVDVLKQVRVRASPSLPLALSADLVVYAIAWSMVAISKSWPKINLPGPKLQPVPLIACIPRMLAPSLNLACPHELISCPWWTAQRCWNMNGDDFSGSSLSFQPFLNCPCFPIWFGSTIFAIIAPGWSQNSYPYLKFLKLQ